MAFNLLGLFGSKDEGATAVAEPPRLTKEQLEEARVKREMEAAKQLKEQQELEAAAKREQLATALRVALQPELIPLDGVEALYAKSTECRTPALIEAEIVTLTTAVAQLAVKHKESIAELLPVEAQLSEAMQAEFKRVTTDLNQRTSQRRQELDRAKLDVAYPRIDLGFMRRRKFSEKHACAMPLFAMFSLDNPICRLEVLARNSGRGNQISSGSAPQLFATVCPDSVQTLTERVGQVEAWRSRIVAITARFAGAIPADVRVKIKTAQKQFTRLYLVSESPEWDIMQAEGSSDQGYQHSLLAPPIPVQRDPLVIGECQGIYWLVAAFETTPAEDYARREFTSGGPLPPA